MLASALSLSTISSSSFASLCFTFAFLLSCDHSLPRPRFPVDLASALVETVGVASTFSTFAAVALDARGDLPAGAAALSRAPLALWTADGRGLAGFRVGVGVTFGRREERRDVPGSPGLCVHPADVAQSATGLL